MDPQVLDFLHQFGYLQSPAVGLFGFADSKATNSEREALVHAQLMAGIDLTGEDDAATQGLLTRPRCGFPDPLLAQFVVQGNKWDKTSLSYGFVETTPDLGDAETRAIFRRAFSVWAAATPLNFTEAHSGHPDITIRFVRRAHGDGNDFDGPGRVLAHAYFPPPNGGSLAGDIHMDEDEDWRSTDCETVAMHEIGHALGLAHSDNPAALMWPYITKPHRFLHADDREGIQKIYGARKEVPTPPTPPAPPTPPKEDPSVAITSDGWITWAQKLLSTANHVNPGVNPVKGIFLHSAEGYKATLLDPNSEWGYNGTNSWQGTVLFDGTLYQHYPLTARCWHATAANQSYVGFEFEGDAPKEASLTEAQIVTARRLIKDISAWKHGTPSRPSSPVDSSHTLWEHREVVRIGGSATACPSGRIPWEKVLDQPAPPPPPPYRPTPEEIAHTTHYAYTGYAENDRKKLKGNDLNELDWLVKWYKGEV